MTLLQEQEALCLTAFARFVCHQSLSRLYSKAYILELCAPENVIPVQDMINGVINEDTNYARKPLELRNQRTYAVKSGVNGLLDVARTTYKEAMEDAYQHSTELGRLSSFNAS